MELGPLGVFTSFSDGWLISSQARKVFSVSALFTLALTVLLFSHIDIREPNLAERIVLGILGVIGSAAILFLWAGMCRYWSRFDDSGRWLKWLWLVSLLLGFPWGSCVYFLLVFFCGKRCGTDGTR